MAMAASEIDQVTHLIDRSNKELQSQIDKARKIAFQDSLKVDAVNSSIFKVILVLTAVIQVELIATAWWLASH